MDTNKILSANLLDLIFDDRNKAYGAYELRVTYPRRIKKALIITMGVSVMIFAGAILANSLKPAENEKFLIRNVVELTEIKEEEPPLPPPQERLPEPEPVRTVHLAAPEIVPDEQVEEPPPTQEEAKDAKIDVMQQDGVDDKGITEVSNLDGNKGVIEGPKNEEPLIHTIVQVQAKFNGDWEKFLLRNLNPNVPVDHGAPLGRHKVVVQFVVDIDGSVSAIQAISNLGYGMEQEAIRVLKKATKWEPAIQNGYKVKAYRQQSIVFEVLE